MEILDENEDKKLIKKLLRENKWLLILGLSLEVLVLVMYLINVYVV